MEYVKKSIKKIIDFKRRMYRDFLRMKPKTFYNGYIKKKNSDTLKNDNANGNRCFETSCRRAGGRESDTHFFYTQYCTTLTFADKSTFSMGIFESHEYIIRMKKITDAKWP